MLLAVLMFGMASVTTSCSDDDKDTNEQKEQQEEELLQQQSQLNFDFYNVMSKLAGVEDMPDDWQTKTFTATIGEPSQQSEATRLVATNTAEDAALRFEDLTGVSLGVMDAYEWKRDFGTLTYKKSRDGQSWATVDVDIKQLPGLKRIVYCAPDQMGLNGSFDGNAYYRFGDVVTKPNSDGDIDYWICVRPAFGKEGKQDSHWITLSKLPQKNIYSYTSKGGITHQLPTKLNSSLVHMGNLAEMLYAIMNPIEWNNYYNEYEDKVFNDFSEENIRYHNQYYWQLVQNAWNELDIWQKVLHTNRETLLARKELTFFYSGYSWWLGSTGNVYTATYSGDNYKTLTKQTLSYDFKSKEKPLWDINQWGKEGYNSNYEPHYAYVVRYATGKQLMGSQPNEFMAMDNVNGIKDFYVFNKYNNQPIGKGKEYTPQEFTKDYLNPKAKSYGFFHPGTIIKDEEGHLWMCYMNWADIDLGDDIKIKTDHKARFISFDAVKGVKEDIDYVNLNYADNLQCTEGVFATNLVPEEQAYILAWSLSEAAFPGCSQGRAMNASLEMMGVNPKDLVIERDTFVINSSGIGATCKNYATNVAYIPTNGRLKGRQPMLRYVRDETRAGKNRENPTEAYKYNYFYTKYIGEVDVFMFNSTMDVLDSYQWAHLGIFMVPADRWSITCWPSNNDFRFRVFAYTDALREPYDYQNHLYDTQAHKWFRNKDKDNTIPSFIPSLYFEPIVIVAYMEIDDDDQIVFKTNYGGKNYTLINDPLDKASKSNSFSYFYNLRNVVCPYTFVDEELNTDVLYPW
jgi:hypothetical protein